MLKKIIFLLAGTLFLMCAAFYNGFPIVYSDSSTYMASGFGLETPFDRPINYGIILRLMSFNGLSLWSVVFFQSLAVAFLIFLLFRQISGEKKMYVYGAITILILSVCTGLPWNTGQMMPDIFTSVALISLILILRGTITRGERIFLHILFFLSVSFHMSHVVLFTGIILLTWLSSRFLLPKENFPKKHKQLGFMLFLTLLTIVTMGSALAKSKHAFFMGAMVEHGIAKAYLDEHCGKEELKFCQYKDSLPGRAYEFLWDANSPFYKMGGFKETKEEFSTIIYGSMTEPKFIAMHISESLKATAEQLTLFGIGDGNGPFLEGTQLHERVGKYFPHELKQFESAVQQKGGFMNMSGWNLFFNTFILICLAAAIFIPFLFRNILTGDLKFIVILLGAGIILNAWDCATFANAIDRLGCRMIWLLPLAVSLMIAKAATLRQKN